MALALGVRILEFRKATGLTQDQFGQKYDISGPAIFKFEKNFVKPSLGVWIRMARDSGMTERKAVLLWLREKLPKKYQKHYDVEAIDALGDDAESPDLDYGTVGDPKVLRTLAASDDNLPSGLKEMLSDDIIWALVKPTGDEINILRDHYGQLGSGSADDYREALRLTRRFLRND